jgi:hypothetical protein
MIAILAIDVHKILVLLVLLLPQVPLPLVPQAHQLVDQIVAIGVLVRVWGRLLLGANVITAHLILVIKC